MESTGDKLTVQLVGQKARSKTEYIDCLPQKVGYIYLPVKRLIINS